MVNLKVEALEIEKRIRKELSVQFSQQLNAIKSREADKQMKARENINTYHETRMNILQHSIKKDRRLRLRRSRSVDTILTIDSTNPMDAVEIMDTINTGATRRVIWKTLGPDFFCRGSFCQIYTIKTRLMCIYMFICTELIEETGRPPGLIFGRDIFGLARTSSSLGKYFTHLTEL